MARDLTKTEKAKVEKEFKKFQKTEYKDKDFNKALKNESKITEKANKGALAEYASYVPLFFSMLKDVFTKKYKEIPKGSIAAILGTLLYIFAPIDVIPDTIPVLGLIDDASVLKLCLNFVAYDIEKYKVWKENTAN